MPYGYTGKILRVNLADKTTNIEEISDVFYRQYFGGRGLISYYLYKEVNPCIDPLGPENKLIFATGVLTGSPFAGSGRNSIGAKSPLTGGYGDGEMGGFWGVELKKAGFDAIIIEGCSEYPVYIYIKDSNIEILDAKHLWGCSPAEVQTRLRSDFNDRGIQIAQIGQGGEKLVRFACISSGLRHYAGRCGLGAVMGSKKLKAIAVRGSTFPKLADPKKIGELARSMVTESKDSCAALYKYGTNWAVTAMNINGGLPTRNFQEGYFEKIEGISGDFMQKFFVSKEGCYSCPIRCKRTINIQGKYNIGTTYGGPEYETVASLGSLCYIDNLEAIAKANEICAEMGIDTISTGVTIAYAMEAFEKGIIGIKETDGLDLRFGNSDAMVQLVGKIGRRIGFGNVLAEGVKRASERIGKGSQNFAIHVKGQEVPLHDPRLKPGLGIGYAISPTGADHCHNMHDTAFANNGATIDSFKPLGILEPASRSELSSKKMRILTYVANWRHWGNCAVYCYFVPWSFKQMEELVKATTNWDTSTWELMKVGERAATLARCFNIREGMDSSYDILSSRFFQPGNLGPNAGSFINSSDFEKAKEVYYSIQGWTNNGVPTRGCLRELDIEYAFEGIKQYI